MIRQYGVVIYSGRPHKDCKLFLHKKSTNSGYFFREFVLFSYTLIRTMYRTACICPSMIRLFLVNLAVRMGHTFLTIWPPTEPASREVRSPL